jgi:NAD(P)-dependent dehydrogenase (short-subunit alcohol dehydrogenase family)
LLREQGWGRIINISGGNARNAGNLSGGARNVSLVHMTKTLSNDLGRHGITVNCIHPGTTRTPRQNMMLERQARDAGITMEQAEARAIAGIPIGRMVEPDDIADLILFLVSDRAGAITGQTIGVEGGAVRAINY